MRLVALYLVGYVALVAGAVLTLWTSGILVRLPASWVAVAIGAALVFGLLLVVVSRPPRRQPPRDRPRRNPVPPERQ